MKMILLVPEVPIWHPIAFLLWQFVDLLEDEDVWIAKCLEGYCSQYNGDSQSRQIPQSLVMIRKRWLTDMFRSIYSFLHLEKLYSPVGVRLF